MAAARHSFLNIIMYFLSATLQLLIAEERMMWFRDSSFDNLIPLNITMTSSFVTTSDFQCARGCQNDATCNSFFYNDVSKTCSPQWLVFTSPRNAKEEIHWGYYRLSTGFCPPATNYVIDRVSMTCYRPVTSHTVLWIEAREACRDNNEMLTVLEPVAKAHFVFSFLHVNNDIDTTLFIGGSRPDGTWDTATESFVWLTGQPVNTTALQAYKHPLFPAKNVKKNVLIVSPSKGTLHNGNEGFARGYICERRLSLQ